jgi:hypothetical protein
MKYNMMVNWTKVMINYKQNGSMKLFVKYMA